MTTNSYFESSFTARYADQELFEDLIIESIQIHGRDYYYLPRTLTNFDKFFGEDSESEFKDIAQIEMYLESTEGWEGDGSFISKFGMEIRDEATLVVSRRRWKETMESEFGLKFPREGDIIVFPDEIDRHLRAFEISWVDDEPTFYQLGKLNTFRMKVKVFEHNGETFDTGVHDIDTYNKYSFAQRLQLQEGGLGLYQAGEEITQGNNFKAIVLEHDTEEMELVISANTAPNAEAYNPDDILPIIGSTSNAVWYLDEVEDNSEHMKISDNDVLHDELKDLISTKEHNPLSGL